MDVVVFTGRLTKWSRKEATAVAEAKGYKVGGSVTGATTILVYGEDAGQKVDAAKKKGIKLFSEEEWSSMIGDSDDAKKPAPALAKARGTKRKASDETPEVVVFTSKLTKSTVDEAKDAAKAKGFKVVDIMGPGVHYLVGPEDKSGGQRHAEAKKRGITILTEDEWQEKLDDVPGSPQKKTAAAGEAEFDPLTASIGGIKPKTLITDGHFHEVKSSSSNSTYLAKRIGSTYTCNCPAWRNQRVAPTTRTCKHLKELLGDEYEAARTQSTPKPMSGSSSPTKAGGKKASSPTSGGSIKCTAPDVLLAKKFEREKQNPTNWWISEKLDGVRAFWSADKQVFLSRLGNSFPAPDWFTKALPKDTDLDGELFGGRGQFQFTVGIAKTANSPQWEKLVYKVFDVPSLKQKPFEDRMKHAQTLVKKANSKYIEWVDHVKCKSLAHLDEEFDKIEKLGGEGLMIREPGSKYSGGRSSSLLKIKSFHDGEALVIAYEDGKGKYKGMCGALRCQMASGKMFKCASGLSDDQRENPPAIGSIIVYKCQELTNDGIPRFPVFVGEAADKDKPTDPIIANAVGREE